MSAQQPVRRDLLDLSIVLPDAETTLRPKCWPVVASAWVLATQGHPTHARALLARLEGRLGVHDAHRQALATSTEAVQRGIREGKRRAKLAEARRASSLAAATRIPEPSEAVKAQLRAADHARNMAQALRLRGAREHSEKIRAFEMDARRANIEADRLRAAELDADWHHKAVTESARLAYGRGEEVEHETVEMVTFEVDEDGAILRHKVGTKRGQPVTRVDRVTRMVNLDRKHGLVVAFDKGHLDGGRGAPKAAALFQTGNRYRIAFEALDPLSAASGEGAGSGGGGAKSPQLRHVIAGETLKIMRAGLEPDEIKVLDDVCGLGVGLWGAANLMRRGVPAARRRLRHALRLAADNWKAAKEAGQVGKAQEAVRTGNALIRKAR